MQIFLYNDIDMTSFETFNTNYLWVSLSPVSIMYENLSSISKHNSKSGSGCDGSVSECPYQSCQTAASSSGSARLYLDFYSLHNVLSDVCFSSAINIQAPPRPSDHQPEMDNEDDIIDFYIQEEVSMLLHTASVLHPFSSQLVPSANKGFYKWEGWCVAPSQWRCQRNLV